MTVLRKARAALLLLVLGAAWPAAAQLDFPEEEEEEPLKIELSQPPAKRSTAEEQIRTLLELSGLAARARRAPTTAQRQAIAAIGGETGQASQHFARLFSEEFEPESILQGVVDQLVSGYDQSTTRALLEWYRSPTGEKIGAAIAGLHSPEGEAQLMAFARRIRSQPPTPQRRQLAERLDEATETSRGLTFITTEMNLSLTTALDRVQGVTADPDQRATAIRRRLSGVISTEARTYLLFLTRTFSMKEVEEYVAFSQSDPARWLRRASRVGYQQGIADALRAFEASFSGWVEQRDVARSREMAEAEGRLYGTGKQDHECLPQALRREGDCEDVVCQASTKAFLSKCLEASQPTPGQCNRVPASSQARASRQWRLRVCGRLRRGDRFCRALMSDIQAHCEQRKQPTAAEPS
jgi:hypothetical protein